MTPAGLTELSRGALIRIFVLYVVLATAIVALTTLVAHRNGTSGYHSEQHARRDVPAHRR